MIIGAVQQMVPSCPPIRQLLRQCSIRNVQDGAFTEYFIASHRILHFQRFIAEMLHTRHPFIHQKNPSSSTLKYVSQPLSLWPLHSNILLLMDRTPHLHRIPSFCLFSTKNTTTCICHFPFASTLDYFLQLLSLCTPLNYIDSYILL